MDTYETHIIIYPIGKTIQAAHQFEATTNQFVEAFISRCQKCDLTLAGSIIEETGDILWRHRNRQGSGRGGEWQE